MTRRIDSTTKKTAPKAPRYKPSADKTKQKTKPTDDAVIAFTELCNALRDESKLRRKTWSLGLGLLAAIFSEKKPEERSCGCAPERIKAGRCAAYGSDGSKSTAPGVCIPCGAPGHNPCPACDTSKCAVYDVWVTKVTSASTNSPSVERLPYCFRTSVTRNDAELLVDKLKKVGATAEIRLLGMRVA